MSALPPYSGPMPRCVKCGHMEADTQYVAGEQIATYEGRVVRGNVGGDELERSCRRCHYTWREAPADAGVVPLETQVEVLTTLLKEELVSLWGDLDEAIHHAASPSSWSIRCYSLADRIQVITHAVGPVDPDQVRVTRLLDDTYDRLHGMWGVTPPAWDRDKTQAWWDEYQKAQRVTLTAVTG